LIAKGMSAIEAAFFGSLGRDAESKTSKAGKPYLRLNIRAGDGDVAQWVSVTCFDQKAIEAVDKLVKGARIYCEGSIKLDEWSAGDGTKKHGLSCASRTANGKYLERAFICRACRSSCSS
jgi:single-stranded DNA-binding protein